jgi:hypothetical protein
VRETRFESEWISCPDFLIRRRVVPRGQHART